MKNKNSVIARAFGAVFAAAFLWLSEICLVYSSPDYLNEGTIILVGVCAAIAMLLICLAFRPYQGRVFSRHKVNIAVQKLLPVLLFGIYLALQIQVARTLYFSHFRTWDFNVVAETAADYCNNGYLDPDYYHGFNYYRMWPNNIPMFLLLVAAFKPFSAFMTDFTFVGIGLNIVCIDLSVLLVYLTLKKLRGHRAAGIVGMLLMMLTLPLLMYVPVYYTDTVSMPFAILTFYLWLLAKENIQKGCKKRAALMLVLMGAAAGFGGRLKLTAAFMLIAVVIDALLSFRVKSFASLTAIALAGFLSIYIPFGVICTNTPIIPEAVPEDYIPKTHWIMMGLNGSGIYNDDDYQFTLSIPPENRDKVVMKEIKNRIFNRGRSGMTELMWRKNAVIWGEGSYYSVEKIHRDRALPNYWVDTYYKYDSPFYTYAAHYNQGMMLLNLVSAVYAGAAAVFSKKRCDILPCLISLFGVFLFFCMWEARSRYIFNYLPVFITVTANCIFAFGSGISRLSAKAKSKKE